MRYPSIDQLLEKIDSKYKLAMLAAKRARAIESGSQHQVSDPYSTKPVGIALEEILKDKLNIKY